MVRKPHMKSVRLSDKVCGYIEQADGYTFTEKLENFVLHAVDDEDALNRRLEAKRAECRMMCEKLDMSDKIFRSMFSVVNELEDLRSQLDEFAGKKFMDDS